MSTVVCPKCGEINAGNRTYCVCGFSLKDVSRQQAPTSATSFERQRETPTTYTPSYYPSNDYTALRGIASLCIVLSWVIVVLAGLSVIGGLLTLRGSFIVGFGIIMFSVVIGGLSFIFLRVIAESISVILDIESHTRRAAVILEQRLK